MRLRGMRYGIVALTAALVMGTGLTAQGAPLVGDYDSEELPGNVLMGRWSQGYILGDWNAVGNGAHAASWDGLTLGGQWELSGATIASTSTLYTNPTTGVVVMERIFDVSTAQLALKDTGPWWNAGDPGTEYIVNLTSYEQTLVATVDPIGGGIVNATSVEAFAGTFQNYPGQEVVGGHTVGVYESSGPVVPADYPSFAGHPPADITGGSWGVVEGTRFTISPVIPEPATMGLVGFGLAIMAVATRPVRRRAEKA